MEFIDKVELTRQLCYALVKDNKFAYQKTFYKAINIIEQLPKSLPVPTLVIYTDGLISLNYKGEEGKDNHYSLRFNRNSTLFESKNCWKDIDDTPEDDDYYYIPTLILNELKKIN